MIGRGFGQMLAIILGFGITNGFKWIHDDDSTRLMSMMAHISKLVHEYKQVETATSTKMEQLREMNLLKWEAPDMRSVKLNTDGARDKRRNTICGGLIRGNKGECLRGVSKHIGVCNIYIVGFWGVYEGLHLATSMGFRCIYFNVDAQQVVTDINTNNASNIMDRKLLPKIRSFFHQDSDFKITHVYRETNLYTDALDKNGLIHPNDTCVF